RPLPPSPRRRASRWKNAVSSPDFAGGGSPVYNDAMSWAGVVSRGALCSLLVSNAAHSQVEVESPGAPAAQFPPVEPSQLADETPAAPVQTAPLGVPPAAAPAPKPVQSAAPPGVRPSPRAGAASQTSEAAYRAPVLPPPDANVCQDRRGSAYETGVDCGGICRPCQIDQRCAKAQDCVSGLCQ